MSALRSKMSLKCCIKDFFNVMWLCLVIWLTTGYIGPVHGELFDQVKLVDDLMREYDRNVRPVQNRNDVVIIDFSFFISSVLDMNEKDQHLSYAAWLTLIWQDEFLKWKPKQYHGLKKIKIPAGTIWLPDIYFYNNVNPTFDNFLNGTIVKIMYTGEIQWAAPVNFKGLCLLDITYFPFDRQLCEMKFGPWQHDGTEILLRGSASSVFTSNGEWDMDGLAYCENNGPYNETTGPPNDATFHIIFARRPQYYIFNLVMPSLLITLLASLAFLLPPQSQGKVGLGVTFLLSMTVFLKIVAKSLPPTNTVPVLGQYFASAMLLVSMSLVLNAIVVTVFAKAPSGEPVPVWLRNLTIYILGPMVRVNTGDLAKAVLASRKRVRSNNKSEGLFSSSREIEFQRIPNGARSAFDRTDTDAPEIANCMDYAPSIGMNRLESVALEIRKVNNILANMGQTGQGGTSSGSSSKSPEEKQNEKAWIAASRVLDRSFFLLYLLGNAMSVLMFIFQILHLGTPDRKLCEGYTNATAAE